MKRKKQLNYLFIFVLLIFLSEAFAKVDYKDQASISMGLINSGFSQTEDAISDSKTAQSGSVSVIALDFSYEFFSTRRRSYMFKTTISGIAGEVSKYYAVHGGQRFYFGADGASGIFVDKNLKVTTTPIFRYYAGWSIGGFYMIYEPGDEVRSDTGLELGGHGGVLYAANSQTSYKAEVGVLRGIGVETTSFDIQIFLGASFFLNSLF